MLTYGAYGAYVPGVYRRIQAQRYSYKISNLNVCVVLRPRDKSAISAISAVSTATDSDRRKL